MVGTDSGTVEHIGLKTTRLRSPSGEQLIFSNSELLKSRIKNYKRMPERNVTAVLSLDYNTPLEKLEKVPTIIENIFKDIPHSRLNRCHLARLGSSALEFEILYSVLSQDPILHIQSQNKLNFLLLEKLHEQKITIPFPTQTIRIESQT
jgi:small-conductance mechanosensitive channel